ncbi:hypothetical protein SAMN05421882_100482 [Nitrosomonas communis]|uniref:Uncharacterized protein n=1 Tax=Nitrosomonas communis TaxID=44574 RepID=A0A1H2REY8_9PROT|nr:hypothetical protein SAMN05421882_100482 [Nitrosomonas communis]
MSSRGIGFGDGITCFALPCLVRHDFSTLLLQKYWCKLIIWNFLYSTRSSENKEQREGLAKVSDNVATASVVAALLGGLIDKKVTIFAVLALIFLASMSLDCFLYSA